MHYIQQLVFNQKFYLKVDTAYNRLCSYMYCQGKYCSKQPSTVEDWLTRMMGAQMSTVVGVHQTIVEELQTIVEERQTVVGGCQTVVVEGISVVA